MECKQGSLFLGLVKTKIQKEDCKMIDPCTLPKTIESFDYEDLTFVQKIDRLERIVDETVEKRWNVTTQSAEVAYLNVGGRFCGHKTIQDIDFKERNALFVRYSGAWKVEIKAPQFGVFYQSGHWLFTPKATTKQEVAQ